LITFVQIKNHFKQPETVTTSLFTTETRSETLRKLYDAAAKTPVPAITEMDRLLGDPERRSSDAFLCTPVLGQTRRRMRGNVDLEIETSVVSIMLICVCVCGPITIYPTEAASKRLRFFYDRKMGNLI
jgi:hypothetical protein